MTDDLGGVDSIVFKNGITLRHSEKRGGWLAYPHGGLAITKAPDAIELAVFPSAGEAYKACQDIIKEVARQDITYGFPKGFGKGLFT